MSLIRVAAPGPEATATNGLLGTNTISTGLITLTDGAMVVDAVSSDRIRSLAYSSRRGITEKAATTAAPAGGVMSDGTAPKKDAPSARETASRAIRIAILIVGITLGVGMIVAFLSGGEDPLAFEYRGFD